MLKPFSPNKTEGFKLWFMGLCTDYNVHLLIFKIPLEDGDFRCEDLIHYRQLTCVVGLQEYFCKRCSGQESPFIVKWKRVIYLGTSWSRKSLISWDTLQRRQVTFVFYHLLLFFLSGLSKSVEMGASYSVSGLSSLTSSSSRTRQTLQTFTYRGSTRIRKKKCLKEHRGTVDGSKPGSQELQQVPGLPWNQDHPVEEEVDSKANYR